MKRAIYPGSFDPITFGHLDVARRGAELFDELIIAVAENEQKSPLFSRDERVALIEEACADVANIRVDCFEGLIVDFAKKTDAVALVRGLRAVSDFEFEFQMALMNRKLNPDLETVFLTPIEEYTYVSSRLVKEVARLGGDVDHFVPPNVVAAMQEKFSA